MSSFTAQELSEWNIHYEKNGSSAPHDVDLIADMQQVSH